MAMQRQMPSGPKEFLLLSTLLMENLPLKYQQQEVAISHQHATTAVTSPTSMQDMKGTTPLVPFSRSLSFSSLVLLQGSFQPPPTLTRPTHTYPLSQPTDPLTNGEMSYVRE